jgi:CubicO group peptidase (beta-lactamase class C family)
MKHSALLFALYCMFSTAGHANEFVTKPKDSPFPVADLRQARFTAEGLRRIDTFFASEIDKKRVPGAVVGVLQDGKLVYLKAHGLLNPESQAPMRVDSIFALASMTKPMVSVGALSLTQQGKLPLFAKAADYVPEIGQMKVAVAKPDGTVALESPKRQITIQDLMRHTSGLTYGGRPDTTGSGLAQYPTSAELPAMKGTPDFIQRISSLPLVYHPGSVFEYSVSFELLGAVIEKTSGKSLDHFLRDSLWVPLGMKDTGFYVPANQRARQARPFRLNPLDGKPQRVLSPDPDITFECGGGCSFGTVPDYLRFGQMLINGGAFNGTRILSPQMVNLMTHNHLTRSIENRVANVEPHRDGYGFGLGVSVRLEAGLAAVPGSVGEYSWNGAFGTGFFADPKEKMVVVFGTAAPGDLRKYYREQVQDLVYGAMTR